MITDREGYEEDVRKRVLTATLNTDMQHLIPHAEFQNKRAVFGQLLEPSQDGLHLTQCQIQSRGSQTPPQPEDQAGGSETMMYKMSPRLTPGSCVQGISNRQVSASWNLF